MSLRASSSNGAVGSTAVSVPVPAGVLPGDIIILAYASDTGTVTVTLPAGFTSLGKANGFGSNGQSTEVSWKRASAADTGSYSWTGTSGGDYVVQAFAFAFRDGGSPPVLSTAAINNSFNASPVTYLSNSVSALAGDDLLFLGVPDTSSSLVATMTTNPSGFATVIAATNFGASNMGSAEQDATASTGPITATAVFTSTALQSWVAWLLRIPAASSGGAVQADFLVRRGHGQPNQRASF